MPNPSVHSFVLIFSSSADPTQTHTKSQTAITDPSFIEHFQTSTMCIYNFFTFECGCESQAPDFLFPCPLARVGQLPIYAVDLDNHGGLPFGCRRDTVNQDRIIPGKCASHRLQARIENKIRELKDDIKQLKDDIAGHEEEIKQEKKSRRVRHLVRQGQHGGSSGLRGRGDRRT